MSQSDELDTTANLEPEIYATHPHLRELFCENITSQDNVIAVHKGMYGDGSGASGDTSGFAGIVREVELGGASVVPPFGGWFDDVANRMAELVPGFATRVSIWRDQITFVVVADKLKELAKVLRDDPELRFEVIMNLSGVHYPNLKGRELHVVYHLLSMTHNRRIGLEVELPVDNPHVESLTPIYPMADYDERETYDMFGVIFDHHPGLTRILMPDDWEGYPQRKDYPLGGIPVEFKGAVVPPPDERRSYQL